MHSRLFINAQLFITLDHIFDVVRDNRASFSIRTDSIESRRSRLVGMGCCQMHIHKSEQNYSNIAMFYGNERRQINIDGNYCVPAEGY